MKKYLYLIPIVFFIVCQYNNKAVSNKNTAYNSIAKDTTSNYHSNNISPNYIEDYEGDMSDVYKYYKMEIDPKDKPRKYKS